MIGYLLGGIPFGLLVGRLRGVDLRTTGSRNIGATNAFRVLGPKWGTLVFLLDATKGSLAAFVPRIAAGSGALTPDLLGPTLVAGIAAILGHVFTPWLRFRGGRGVATSLGVFLGIMPLPTLMAFGLWIALVAVSKRVSVGSIVAALAYPFLVWRFAPEGLPRGLVTGAAGLVALLVVFRHHANIRRLLNGTEPPILGRAARSDAAPGKSA